MSANNFLPFCPTDSGTNLLSQSEYAAAANRTVGNQPGVASSKLNNKAFRQSSFVVSQLAQLISNVLSNDVLDDGNTDRMLAQLTASMQYRAPVYTKLTTGSGTWNKTFVFFIASGNATVGATYTNNAFVFTVKSTIAAGVVLETTGNGAPAVSGTLTKASGTGDATLTFYAVKSALYLKVKMVGAGGGGAGSSTVAASDGGDGGDGTATTFGSALLSAGGGGKGKALDTSGNGGASSLGAATGLALQGGKGQPNGVGQTAPANASGGAGAASPYGGAGAGGKSLAQGSSGIANSGSGGGGAGSPDTGASERSGGGGSAGGFVDAIVFSPNATYAYSIGVGGAAGAAGSSGAVGGAGADGLIEVTECFQ